MKYQTSMKKSKRVSDADIRAIYNGIRGAVNASALDLTNGYEAEWKKNRPNKAIESLLPLIDGAIDSYLRYNLRCEQAEKEMLMESHLRECVGEDRMDMANQTLAIAKTSYSLKRVDYDQNEGFATYKKRFFNSNAKATSLPTEKFNSSSELKQKYKCDKLQTERNSVKVKATIVASNLVENKLKVKVTVTEQAVATAEAIAKSVEGKPETKPQCLVALRDLETSEDSVYYLVRGKMYFSFGLPVFEDIDPIPDNLPPNVSLLRTSSPTGRQLPGKFVGDRFSVNVPDGVVSYLVLWTGPVAIIRGETVPKVEATEQTEKLSNYEGRGRNDGNHSDTIDGSRYIGYIARDNGQWGSFPMHDDYSDESDAEGKDYGEWADWDHETN